MHVKRIILWSCPRCSSTSLMYSFAQRPDTLVFDEPFYGYYLKETPNKYRSYRDIVLSSMYTTSDEVVKNVIFTENFDAKQTKNLFFKCIGKFLLPSLDKRFLFHPEVVNVFLIRKPANVVRSYYMALNECHPEDIGIDKMVELYQLLINNGKRNVAIVDNDDLIADPRGILQLLCKSYLNIEFDPRQLSWPPGGIPEDGIWNKLWYTNLHQTTGFTNTKDLKPTAPEADMSSKSLQRTIRKCQPYYDYLHRFKIKLPNQS